MHVGRTRTLMLSLTFAKVQSLGPFSALRVTFVQTRKFYPFSPLTFLKGEGRVSSYTVRRPIIWFFSHHITHISYVLAETAC